MIKVIFNRRANRVKYQSIPTSTLSTIIMNSTMNIDINSVKFTCNKFALNKQEFESVAIKIILTIGSIADRVLFLIFNVRIHQADEIRNRKIAAVDILFQYLLNNCQYIYPNSTLSNIIIKKLGSFIDGEEDGRPWFGAIIYAERLFPGALKYCKNYTAAYNENKHIINARRGINSPLKK